MFKTFKSFSSRDWIMTAILVGFVVMQVWAALQLPYYMGSIINFENTVSEVIRYGGFLLLYSVISIIGLIFMSGISTAIGANVARRLRSRIFDKVQSFSPEELGEFSTPSLITRTTNDVNQVSMAVQMSLRFLIQMPIMLAYATYRILRANLHLSAVVGVAVVVLLMLVGTMVLVVVPRFSFLQKLTDKINAAARENLTGLRVVRAYNAESYQEAKFEAQNKTLTSTHLFIDRVYSLFNPLVNLIMNGLTLGIFWVGAHLINNVSGGGNVSVTPSTLVEFMALAAQIIMAFLLMVMALIFVPRGMVSAKRIYEVLDKPLTMLEGEGVSLENQDGATGGEVEFRGVSFKYPDAQEYVLNSISFKASKGQTVGFIGSTGSGKSTLIKLVPRFFDATDGEVLIDGVNVKRYKRKELGKKLGYVPQKGVLFTGTIKSNIVFGDNTAADEDIKKAAEVAKAAEFISQKDGQYDAPISQGGKNVSGGQKQRLSIARAIVKNPPIYIFDDSFSALDFKTDKELRAALKQHTKSATCLIVASRIGTIMSADKIVVLDQGRLVGEGTHEELLNTCSVYQEIAHSQLNKEELI